MGYSGKPKEEMDRLLAEPIPEGHARCNYCANEFEQPEGKKEPHGQTLHWCPFCGHGDWVWWDE